VFGRGLPGAVPCLRKVARSRRENGGGHGPKKRGGTGDPVRTLCEAVSVVLGEPGGAGRLTGQKGDSCSRAVAPRLSTEQKGPSRGQKRAQPGQTIPEYQKEFGVTKRDGERKSKRRKLARA